MCDSGDIEFALTIVDYVVGLGDARTIFTSIPSDKRPIGCNLAESKNTFFIHIVIESEGGRDESCVAIDDIDNIYNMTIRPCTLNEWKYVKNEIGGNDDSVRSVMVNL